MLTDHLNFFFRSAVALLTRHKYCQTNCQATPTITNPPRYWHWWSRDIYLQTKAVSNAAGSTEEKARRGWKKSASKHISSRVSSGYRHLPLHHKQLVPTSARKTTQNSMKSKHENAVFYLAPTLTRVWAWVNFLPVFLCLNLMVVQKYASSSSLCHHHHHQFWW